MNVTTYSGGRVHLQASWNTDAFPECRIGGQNSRGTRYRRIDSPVTCEKCKAYAKNA